MPNMFSEADNVLLGRPITREELAVVLKDCAKEKSPGLNGWGVELFIHFFGVDDPGSVGGC